MERDYYCDTTNDPAVVTKTTNTNTNTIPASLPSSSSIILDSVSASSKLQSGAKCSCLDSDQRHNNNQNAGARIAYLITLHNHRTLEQSLTLVRSVAAPGFIILIHIDAKFDEKEYENSDLLDCVRGDMDESQSGSASTYCGAKIVVESLYDATWGQWSMLDPTIWGEYNYQVSKYDNHTCIRVSSFQQFHSSYILHYNGIVLYPIAMQQLTTNPQFQNQWDVFINLSADSMPVYKPHILSQYFHGPLRGINFVTSSSCVTGLLPTNIDAFPRNWHKSGHYRERGEFEITYNNYTNVGYSYDNSNIDGAGSSSFETVTLKIHFGSQWMALTPSFVEYIASSMTQHDSLPYRFKQALIRKERLMADETFIPTLLAHHERFRETLPNVLENGDFELMEGMSSIR